MSCCGHKFCRECIERVEKDGKGCPLCNTPGFSFMRERALERTLKDMDVFCSFKTEGCEWTGKLKELENHLNRLYSIENQLSGCQFVEVECMYHQCGESLQRRHITTHQSNQCKKRPYSCDYCRDFASTFEEVINKHYPICGKYPVACPNDCSVYKFERQAVERHLENECPLVVVNCPFTYTGCGVTLPRRDMHEHAQDMSTHFKLLGSFTQKLARENENLHLHMVQVEAEAKRMCEVVKKNEEQRLYIEREAEKKQDSLLEKISKLSSICCASSHHIKHSEMLGKKCGYFSSECMTMVAHCTVSKDAEMELRSMYFPVLPFKFRVEKFLSFKKMATDNVVYSPVFYPYGYKLRIIMIRSQYSKALSFDAFMSIYVEIMPGPFDETLKWPFKGSVTIQIVNQLNDHNYYEKTGKFSDETYEKDTIRPDDHHSIKWGITQFIYHKELRYEHCKGGQQTHYTKDGSLQICVTKIDLS